MASRVVQSRSTDKIKTQSDWSRVRMLDKTEKFVLPRGFIKIKYLEYESYYMTHYLRSNLQACTGAMINPSNGERLRVEKAVESGFVAAAFKKHLLLAEQSVFGFETSTG